MICSVISRIAPDTKGAAAIEFALTVPIMATLVTGTMMTGNYLSVRNSLKSALDETSRYASLYPTPTDAQLTAKFNARLTRDIDQNKLKLQIKRVSISSSVKTIELNATYPVKVKFLFADVGEITAKASNRKVFSAQ